jgi:CRISPR-associated protein Cas2
MFVLVGYDVASTTTPEGRRRLRRVAQVCLNFGQRVQFSLFECTVGELELARLRQDLLKEIKPEEDSLRLYFLGEDGPRRVEHHGQKPSQDFEDALVI